MKRNRKDLASASSSNLDRRTFLQATGVLAATTLGGGLALPAFAGEPGGALARTLVSGRRKLGKLEVSSLGLGCQDMTGAFYGTAPRRADMITLIRTAYDRGSCHDLGPHQWT